MAWSGSRLAPMLLKTNSRSKRDKTHFPDYLRKIRECPCVICGGQSEAAHLRLSSAAHGKVNGRNDKWVTPLCPRHHRLGDSAQHTMGEMQFWELHKINPLELAFKLWQARDDLEAMQCIATREIPSWR